MFMFASFLNILSFGIIVTSNIKESNVLIRQPFGIQMCRSLCEFCSACHSLTYDKKKLSCFLGNSRGMAGTCHWSKGPEAVKKTKVKQPKVQHKMNTGRQINYKHLVKGNTHLYVHLHEVKETWNAALQVCQSEGGTLVKLDTRSKQDLFNRKLYSRHKVSDDLWIGLSDRYDNDTWFWTDGTPADHKFWHVGQPSNKHRNEKENCVVLTVAIHVILGVKWNDISCEIPHKYVCERRDK